MNHKIENFAVGNDVWVLLPWWVQSHDNVEPYIRATVVFVSQHTVTIEYDSPNGKQSLVIHELNRISKICLANSYDAEMLVEWEKTQKILDERYPLSSGG